MTHRGHRHFALRLGNDFTLLFIRVGSTTKYRLAVYRWKALCLDSAFIACLRYFLSTKSLHFTFSGPFCEKVTETSMVHLGGSFCLNPGSIFYCTEFGIWPCDGLNIIPWIYAAEKNIKCSIRLQSSMHGNGPFHSGKSVVLVFSQSLPHDWSDWLLLWRVCWVIMGLQC